MRTLYILGFTKMLEAIQNWTPDYNKVVCAIKNAFTRIIYGQNKPFIFLKQRRLIFLEAVK